MLFIYNMVVQGHCLPHCYNFNFLLLILLIIIIGCVGVYIFILKNKSYKEK
jgi:hypothetical protein